MTWFKDLWFITSFYLQRCHWLSLDVVAGAMLTHVIASRLPDGHGRVSWASTLCVGIAVFCIYVIDRLLDNHKSSPNTTPRHHFHAKNEGILIKVIAALGVVGLLCLFWLPKQMFLVGVGLAFLVGLYLLVVFNISFAHQFLLFKEVLVAIIYTTGIWGTTLVASTTISWENSTFMLLFGLVAFQNLLLFSWFESFDVEEGYSLAIIWGTETITNILGWLFIVIVIAAICVVIFTIHRFCVRTAIVVTLMSLGLHLIKLQSKQVHANEQYRWLGDGVFLLALWLL
ncbi:MAG: hypothetical protein R2822_09205 [Spirosomataceae bacterium]